MMLVVKKQVKMLNVTMNVLNVQLFTLQVSTVHLSIINMQQPLRFSK